MLADRNRHGAELSELTHIVQYRRLEQDYDVGWHIMAAFDCERPARMYMAECREGARGLSNIEYRVRKV
jgi:hypothetical protein